MTASEEGTSSAPAMPCSARIAISTSTVGAIAHSTDASPKPASPIEKIFLPAHQVAERAADEQQRAERQQIGLDDPLLRGEAARRGRRGWPAARR